jgi:hypothetical protein
LWQPEGLENRRLAGHIRGMETTIALSAIAVILIFVAVYAISAWKNPGR